MLEQVLGTLLVAVPYCLVLWLLLQWNLRKSKRAVDEAMAAIDRRAAEAIAHMTAKIPGEPPVLAVTLTLKPGVEPAKVAANSVRLYFELDGYERSLGGQGLTPLRSEPVPATVNQVRLEFAAVQAAGARERLECVAAAITEAKWKANPNDGPEAAKPSGLTGWVRVFESPRAVVTSGVPA